jgi:hypothetical protein
MSNQTAMQQLLNQIREESRMDHIPKEWAMCLKSLQIVIQHTYLEIEEEQIKDAWMATDNELQRLAAEKYYNETYITKQ